MNFHHITLDGDGGLLSLSGDVINLCSSSAIQQERRDLLTQKIDNIQGLTIKLFSDGRLIFLDRSNTLYLYDTASKHLLKTLRGSPYKRNNHDLIKPLGFSPDEDLYLWRKSGTTLSVVNLQDFEIKKEVPNFWPHVDTETFSEAIAVCDQETSMILSVCKTSNYGHFVTHYFGNGRMRHAKLTEVFKDGKPFSFSDQLFELDSG